MTPNLEAAISHYHQLLLDDHLDTTRANLERLNADPRVHRAGDPICKMLRPTMIAEGTFSQACEDGLAVVRALNIAAKYALEDDTTRELLDLEQSLGWRLFLDHGVDGVRVNGRLDGLPTRDGPIMFAEYNTNLVGGVVQSHLLPRLLESMPLLDAFRERYPVIAPSTEGKATEALTQAHAAAGGEGKPSLCVVFDGSGAGTLPHDVQEAMMLLQHMAAEGIELLVEGPSALDYRDGRLWIGETTIDYLYAPDEQWPDVFERFGLEHPLFQDAVPSGRVRILNGAALGGLVAEKSMFELLTRPDLAHLFDTATQRALARAVPWTRKVAPRTVDHHGRSVDLFELALQRQREFVIKPTHEEGGDGVVLGWDVETSAWEEALRRASESPHVLQERAELDVQPFARWSGADVEFVPCRYSADPFVWNDARTSGCLSRVSMTDMLNVAGTASLSPVFILRGLER